MTGQAELHGQEPCFFGYGSLINGASHNARTLGPAKLDGWRRVWRGTTLRGPAYLSVEPHESSAIMGLLARPRNGDWTRLDQREAAYHRHDVALQVSSGQSGALHNPVMLYVVPQHVWDKNDDAHPVLLSYLDVVISGILTEFGPAGVAGFFETTTGWRALHDDRAAPIYPRAAAATDAGRAAVDKAVAMMLKP